MQSGPKRLIKQVGGISDKLKSRMMMFGIDLSVLSMLSVI